MESSLIQSKNLVSTQKLLKTGMNDPKKIGARFESIFYRILLEQFNESELAEDPLMSSFQGKQMKQMYNEEIATILGNKETLGFSKKINEWMQKQNGNQTPIPGLIKT